MRVELPGVHRSTDLVEFEFDGQKILARRGESLAAALMEAGHDIFRETHLERSPKRGVLCGMGACSECRVLVDGQTRRACVDPVKPGIKVTRHPSHMPAAAPEHSTAVATLPEEVLTPDVLVVGAGPAGLYAARAAAEMGLEDVLVIDDKQKAGGNYFKRPNEPVTLDVARIDARFKQGQRLVKLLAASGAKFIPEASAWGIFAPWQLPYDTVVGEVRVTTPSRRLKIRPRRLILAVGAYERIVPFTGWQLPGVMTTGAMQTMLRASQIAPSKRVLIAGNGALNLQLARELSDAGVDVVAHVETARAPGAWALKPIAQMALASPALVSQGVSHKARLLMRGIRTMYRHALTSVTVIDENTPQEYRRATVSQIAEDGKPIEGSEQHFDTDIICVSYGFLAQDTLARALGCDHAYDSGGGGLLVKRDKDFRTSVHEVFVAGDAAGGLGGAHIAMSQGTLAGIAAARDLGGLMNEEVEARATVALKFLRRHRQFQAALKDLYRGPHIVDELATPDTMICRCEGVTKARLSELAREDITALRSIKRYTRAGMGHCQGRYCSQVIAEMMQRRTAVPLTESDFASPSPPARPVTIAAMAAVEAPSELQPAALDAKSELL